LNWLVAVIGPTGIGKTAMSVRLAEALHAPIVSADSRQIYREMEIGTARPGEDELSRARFYFVGSASVRDAYSAARYEAEALPLIASLHTANPYVILSGGSMLYVDAVISGIDYIPDVRPEVRARLKERLATEGLASLTAELERVDPAYYAVADLRNPRRVIHALEIYYSSGQLYSSLRVRHVQPRPFRTLKIGLRMERGQLYERINSRVDRMMEAGLEDEARRLWPLRALPALDTVGYRELFACFDGLMSRDEAIEKIKKNTRTYAKKQMTWYKRDEDILWFEADDYDGILNFILKETRG
jgi:tRNA dimethylallyltransferase